MDRTLVKCRSTWNGLAEKSSHSQAGRLSNYPGSPLWNIQFVLGSSSQRPTTVAIIEAIIRSSINLSITIFATGQVLNNRTMPRSKLMPTKTGRRVLPTKDNRDCPCFVFLEFCVRRQAACLSFCRPTPQSVHGGSQTICCGFAVDHLLEVASNATVWTLTPQILRPRLDLSLIFHSIIELQPEGASLFMAELFRFILWSVPRRTASLGPGPHQTMPSSAMLIFEMRAV